MTDIIRIPEHRVDGKPLGRHIHHDPASRQYEAEQATALRSVTHTQIGLALPLNQTRGSCTAEALCGARNMNPDHRAGDKILVQADADQLYDQEIVLEGGNPQTDDPGGTGLYVCKAAKNAGLITSYTHTFSLDAALKALVLSPVMIGSNWYDSMDSPDGNAEVAITPDAQVRGGHEYVARGIDLPSQTVWCWQSWGLDFGWGGRFCMSFNTLERLLGEQGDATVPVR
jgi:hypothetical protein